MSFLSLIDRCKIPISTQNGSTAKQKKIGQIISYLHESRMNHSVKRLPNRCRMIWRRLNFAKMGTTLVPTIIMMNSKKHMPIMA